MSTFGFAVIEIVFFLLAFAACSEHHSGVVSGGTPDVHCQGVVFQPASAYTCPTTAQDSNMASYGATMNGATGDDDDCKYHVSWTATDVTVGKNVTFTVMATWLADGTPVAGANTLIEGYYSNSQPLSGSPTTVENPSGTYTIGPVVFDEKGQWTIRFHFYETCADADNSLHGHAAFYINVAD